MSTPEQSGYVVPPSSRPWRHPDDLTDAQALAAVTPPSQLPASPTPGSNTLRDRLEAALREAAYECPGDDCRLSERECQGEHPVTVVAETERNTDHPKLWVEGTTTALADVVAAVVEPMLHDARNTVRGRCRWCSGILNRQMHPNRPEISYGHKMRCRFYVGPLEHHWVHTRVNPTFGGIDHDCACGGWFRLGGSAGHGDGSETAAAVCPHADQDWRGPRGETP